jgi:hypothetical protein
MVGIFWQPRILHYLLRTFEHSFGNYGSKGNTTTIGIDCIQSSTVTAQYRLSADSAVPVLILILLLAIFAAVFLILFLIFGVPFIRRQWIKSNGELASATILEVRYGRGAVYSGGYNHSLVSQTVILKLEVHPTQQEFEAKKAEILSKI